MDLFSTKSTNATSAVLNHIPLRATADAAAAPGAVPAAAAFACYLSTYSKCVFLV